MTAASFENCRVAPICIVGGRVEGLGPESTQRALTRIFGEKTAEKGFEKTNFFCFTNLRRS